MQRKKVEYIFSICLLFLLMVNLKGYGATPLPNANPIVGMPNNCDDYEGTIHFSYIPQNDTLNFANQFILTDTNELILKISDSTAFENVVAGEYYLYVIDYKKTDALQGNTIGNSINNITANCFSISTGMSLKICPPPSAIKTVSGIVFTDTNEDGIYNEGTSNLNGIPIYIYEDNNQDGQIDINDSLLTTVLTNTMGEYTFTIEEAILGRLITHIVIATDSSSIPTENFYTTDNVETAIFSNLDGVDANNNFGISQFTELENEVWLDINANAIQEPHEVNLPNFEICISNLSPLLVNGVLYPPNTYLDTVYTDINGIYVFDSIPDCDWQIIAHYDPTLYFPTYDADGGILNTTNFTLSEGIITPADNPWCTKADCSEDLDFGFRLAGNINLSGNICIDDGSKDGICITGGEEQLPEIFLSLFTGKGDKLGAVATDEYGVYLFPYLPEDIYIIDFEKEQVPEEKYFFTTQPEDTPASKIVNSQYSIFQKVTADQNIYGLDFAFFPHIQSNNFFARDDVFSICSGINFEHIVYPNDSINSSLYSYTLVNQAQMGTVTIDRRGVFQYMPFTFECAIDQFSYQLCDLVTNRCDTAIVSLLFEDKTAPTITNLPPNLTINCDEQLPAPDIVSAYDNCPNIKIDATELSTQGEDGCSLYDYTLTRTWLAKDFCGNTSTKSQIIKVNDKEAPDIFRIYTLPNGKKMVAGIANLTGERWKTIPFPINFETTPLVFNQVVSNQEETPVIVQTRRVSTAQFEIKIKEEEGNDGIHLYEKVAWIAIEKGGQQTDFSLIADVVEVGSQDPENVQFPTNFSAPPAFFTNLQTTNEFDPVIIKNNLLSSTNATLQLVEETSKDVETAHIKEQVAYLGIENIGDIKNDKGDIIGEVGTTNIENGWNNIALQHTYYNPIILVSSQNKLEKFPYTHRVSNLQPNSFEVQIESWDYLSLQPTTTPISYLVIEGSIPLYVPDFCEKGIDGLILGTDIKAIDNCDNSVELAYSETSKFDGVLQLVERTWQSSDECGNEVAYTQTIRCEGVAIKLHTYLQGALVGSTEEGLMRDDLRKKKLLPIQEPYSQLPNFQYIGSGGGEVLDTHLLQITGNNAIVDWILLELRSVENINQVIASSAALVQRDGDVITPSGEDLVVFRNVPFGRYHIAIRHRNHIGLTTKHPYFFNLNATPEIDFRNIFTAVNGKTPSVRMDNVSALWSGDLNSDRRTIYQGPNNDIFEMFLAVILDDANSHYLTNYISSGYTSRDFNLDGRVIYQGPNNDRANLLINTTLNHPENPAFISNFVISVDDGN